MSHFAVMVIGPNVDEQLAPFHEFECTGDNDQYVQDLDQTQEAREEYEAGTKSMVRLADGTLISAYDDQCYREPTEEEAKKIGPMAGSGCGHGMQWTSKDWGDRKGYRVKVQFLPEGAEKVEVPFRELQTFAAWVKDWRGIDLVPHGAKPDINGDHKFGYATLTAEGEIERVVRRTNPNKHWDWYQIGGRFSGHLLLKPGAKGTWGQKSWTNQDQADDMDCCDAALKGAVDFEGMRDKAGAAAAARWDKAEAARVAAGGGTWESWETVRAKHQDDMDAARRVYHAQEVMQAVKEATDLWTGVDQFLTPRDQYIQRARDNAVSTFAVLKDGQWYERGSMGWWGVVTDEKDRDEWNRKFNELIDGLPDDAQLTVVDCHI